MQWPWQRGIKAHELLVFSLAQGRLHWLLADRAGAQAVLMRRGCQDWPEGAPETALQALRKLGLRPGQAWAVLPMSGYQMLQIEAPAVPPDELRAASRWHIRDRIEAHLDDLTIDVLRVGPARKPGSGQGQLFVVAADNAELQRVHALAQAAGWPLQVIDVADLVQRNLHCAAARALDLGERATACLMRQGEAALLTVCVGDELYYSRRLDWDSSLVERASGAWPAGGPPADDRSPALELGAGGDDAPRLVIELLRSFDVWERSWPDLPLTMMLLDGEPADSVAAGYLQDQLGLRVLGLDSTAAFQLPPLADTDANADRPADWAPLLGALLRSTDRET